MKSWVKLYTESNRDPKIGTLTWEQRGVWAALLALAGELDHRDAEDQETGRLDTVENVAWHLRIDRVQLETTIEALVHRNMIDAREGVLFVTHYWDRQRRAPSDARDATSERKRQQRERTRHECVTSLSRDVTSLDTDTEESREETEENNETIVSLSAGGLSESETREALAEWEQQKQERASGGNGLSDVARFYFDSFGRKRWANRIQEKAFADAEQTYGPEVMRSAIEWAGTRGFADVGRIVKAAETMAKNTGPPGVQSEKRQVIELTAEDMRGQSW